MLNKQVKISRVYLQKNKQDTNKNRTNSIKHLRLIQYINDPRDQKKGRHEQEENFNLFVTRIDRI